MKMKKQKNETKGGGPPGCEENNEVKDSFQGRRWKGETKIDWKMPEKEIKKIEEGRESPGQRARK